MYYVYVLLGRNQKLYVGFTSNLRARIQQHQNGEVWTTRRMLPVSLVFYEAFRAEADARRRE